MRRFPRGTGSTLNPMSAFDDSQLPITLKPSARAVAASRFGSLFVGLLGLAVLAAGVFGALPPVPAVALMIAGAAGALLALTLIARVGGVAVTLAVDEVVIRSNFSTRTVPRTAIAEVTDEPRLVWHDGHHSHRAWLTGLSLYRDRGRSGSMNTRMRSDLQSKLAIVRAWAGEPASSANADAIQ